MRQQRADGFVTLGKAQSNPLPIAPPALHAIPKLIGGLFRKPSLVNMDSLLPSCRPFLAT